MSLAVVIAIFGLSVSPTAARTFAARRHWTRLDAVGREALAARVGSPDPTLLSGYLDSIPPWDGSPESIEAFRKVVPMNSPSASDPARDGFEEILRSFNELQGPPRSPDDVLTVLVRHNLPWLSSRYADDPQLPKHRVSISGHAFDHEHLRDVYRTPLLYRLAFLRQLSTVAMATHLDATHTRLSHAIGTAQIGSRLLSQVRATSDVQAVRELEQKWELGCLLYCFIHDAFHGPMGHSLDMMRSALGMSLAEKLDDEQFAHFLGAAVQRVPDPVAHQLRLAAGSVWPGHEQELLEVLDELSDRAALEEDHPELVFLRDVIDSAIDADRLDYLIRDTELLENTNLRSDFTDLVDSATALQEDGFVRLAFAKSHKRQVARALETRRRLYSEYYEAPEKLVLDDMLCHGLYYVLGELGLTGNAGAPLPEEKRTAAIRQLLLLTDGDLFPVLRQFRASPEAYDLIVRILQRRYFVEFHRVSMSYADAEDLIDGFRGWNSRISELVKRLTTSRRKRNYKEAADRAHDLPLMRDVTAEYFRGVDNDEQILVFGLQTMMQGSFVDRVNFEKGIWARFAADLDSNTDLRTAYLERETGNATTPRIESLDRHPPIHVTTSSFFDVASKEDLLRYLKEGGGEGDREGVLFYSRDKEGRYVSDREETIDTAVMARAQFFPLLLSAPQSLVDLAAEPLKEAFMVQLRESGWLWELLARGRELPSDDTLLA